jgi:hypothetical protein
MYRSEAPSKLSWLAFIVRAIRIWAGQKTVTVSPYEGETDLVQQLLRQFPPAEVEASSVETACAGVASAAAVGKPEHREHAEGLRTVDGPYCPTRERPYLPLPVTGFTT